MKLTFFITFISMICILSGCSKQSDLTNSKSTQVLNEIPSRPTESQPISSLIDTLEQIERSDHQEDCDLKNAAKRHEILKELELNQSNIKKFEVSDTRKYFQKLSIGPIEIYDFNESSFFSNDSWQHEVTSWDKLYAQFQKLGSPESDPHWLMMNHLARSLLHDDQERILSQKSLVYRHSDGGMLLRTIQSIRFCLKNEECTNPRLQPDQIEISTRSSFFKKLWKLWRDEKNNIDRRDILRRIADELNDDYDFFFGFHFNNTVLRKTQSTLALFLDPGPFDTKAVKEIIEKSWRSDFLKLEIVWTSSTQFFDPSSLYKLLDGSSIGNRAYTSWSQKTVTLFQGNSTSTIAHEIGHILGLPDHYYTIWNPKKCELEVEYNLGDIMSNSRTGHVTPQEWAELSRRYPLRIKLN